MNDNTKLSKTKKKCRLCKKEFAGRADKIFCSTGCKNEYHVKLIRVTKIATTNVDKILHRNRSILLEVMGKNGTQRKLPKLALDKKKFNYSYITGYHVNKQGKIVHHIYDFSWMIFSDEEVLIRRKTSRGNTGNFIYS